MPFLFIQRGLAAVTRQGFREIVAADESGRVENGPTNHDSNRRHCMYIQGSHWLEARVCTCALTHWLEVSSDPPGISSGRCCQP